MNNDLTEGPADLSITPSEATLFNIIHFGITTLPPDLCRRALCTDYWLGGPVTRESIQAALTGCLAKGWLRVIDSDSLKRIRDDVQREQLLGPVYGYPTPGGVDFTSEGANQWLRLCERRYGHHDSFAYCDVVHQKSAHYFRSRSKAAAECDRLRQLDGVVSVSGPVPIGRWRANWWRCFPEGYRIDVEERMQWAGICPKGRFLYSAPSDLPVNLGDARKVLDRHNVTLVEWLVLASLEQTSHTRGIVSDVRIHSKRLGRELSRAQCLSGLNACLRNGWILRVNAQVTGDITSRLRDDSAVMPVPFDATEHELQTFDISTDGALLYQMLSAEILGPAWEDCLIVEQSYFREEHRYCVEEAGLDAVIKEYAEVGEAPMSVRTVPIGPWCVYWWQRYCSGYRFELTFGKP